MAGCLMTMCVVAASYDDDQDSGFVGDSDDSDLRYVMF